MPAPAPGSAQTPVNSRSRVLIASLIGTTIEFYDFYIYATAAVLVFPQLFFPSSDPTTALLSSFAVFGAAMVARPIGAVFFGHLGDRLGRKKTLVVSLLTMGIATFLIGVLPTYAQAGWIATALLVLMRLAQGFALGGEWSGAALVATENAPKGKRALYGTFPQLGAPLGFIIGNGLFLIIGALLPSAAGADPTQPSEAFTSWGWRIPFLFSAVMVAIGLWVRSRLVESAVFTKTQQTGKVRKLPLATVVQGHWRQLILGTFIMLATYVLFYLMTTFSLSYGRTAEDAAVPGLGYSYTTFVLMMIFGVLFFAVFTLVSGPLADKYGRRTTLIWLTAAIVVFGLVWVPLIGLGTLGVVLLAGARLHADGHDVRPDGRAAARAVPDQRALHRLRHLVQRQLDPGRGRRAVHRGGAVGGRGRLAVAGRRLPLRDGGTDADRAAARQGDQGRLPGRGRDRAGRRGRPGGPGHHLRPLIRPAFTTAVRRAPARPAYGRRSPGITTTSAPKALQPHRHPRESACCAAST